MTFNGIAHWGDKRDSYLDAISLDSMDNIYLTGRTDNISDHAPLFYLIKFNSSGHLEWKSTWGRNDVSRIKLAIDSTDDIYLTGIDFIDGTENDDLYILKYNSTGHLQWNNTLSVIDYALSPMITVDSSDNIYISGSTYSVGDANLFLMKFDITGKQLWNHTWGGNSDEIAFKIVIDSSDNIYIGGEINGGSYSNGTHWSDIFLVKYSNAGNRLWNQTWDKSKNDYLNDITLDSLGNIYLTGFSEENMAILRYDRFGSFISYTSWGGDDSDFATGIALDSSENIYISGSTRSFGAGDFDMCLVKLVEKPFESTIPGYDLVLLILILSAVSITTLISRFTKRLIRKK